MSSIFALSKDQSYISYSAFYNNGFPVMFSPKNNHIYFSDCNTSYSIYDFSCDKLSLNPSSQNTNKGNLMFDSNQTNMKQFVSEIYVNDHMITCTYNSIIMPIVQKGLKYVPSSNSIEHNSHFTSSRTLNAYTTSTTPNYGYLVSGTTFSTYNITYDIYGHVTNTSFNKMIVPTSEIILSASSFNGSSGAMITFRERINDTNTKTTSTISIVGKDSINTSMNGEDCLEITHSSNHTTGRTLNTYTTSATPNYGYLVSGTTFSAYNITYNKYGHITGTTFNKMIVPTSKIILSTSSNVPQISFEENINNSNVKTTSTIQFKGENNATVYKSENDQTLKIDVPKNVITVSEYNGVKKGFKIESTHNIDNNNVYIITEKNNSILHQQVLNSIGSNTLNHLIPELTYNNNTYYCYLSTYHCTIDYKVENSIEHPINNTYIYPGSSFYTYKFNYDQFGHLIALNSTKRYVSQLSVSYYLNIANKSDNSTIYLYHSYWFNGNKSFSGIPTYVKMNQAGHIFEYVTNTAGVTNIIKCSYKDYNDSSKYNKGAGSYASYLFLIT